MAKLSGDCQRRGIAVMRALLAGVGLLAFMGTLWLPFVTGGDVRRANLPTVPPPTLVGTPRVPTQPPPTITLVITQHVLDTPTATGTPLGTPMPTSTEPTALQETPQPPRP